VTESLLKLFRQTGCTIVLTCTEYPAVSLMTTLMVDFEIFPFDDVNKTRKQVQPIFVVMRPICCHSTTSPAVRDKVLSLVQYDYEYTLSRLSTVMTS
jgi:hypothetical protein